MVRTAQPSLCFLTRSSIQLNWPTDQSTNQRDNHRGLTWESVKSLGLVWLKPSPRQENSWTKKSCNLLPHMRCHRDSGDSMVLPQAQNAANYYFNALLLGRNRQVSPRIPPTTRLEKQSEWSDLLADCHVMMAMETILFEIFTFIFYALGKCSCGSRIPGLKCW